MQFGVNKHKKNFSKTTKLYELIRCVQFVVFEKFKRDDKKVKTEEMLTAHALLCICIIGLGIMSGEQNQTAMKWKSHLLVPSMIQTRLDDTMSCDQLIKIMTKLEKQTRYWLFIFTTQYGHICEMRHTIQLLCPITSMTCIQPY